jgi:AcrR family transcriptional regulator
MEMSATETTTRVPRSDARRNRARVLDAARAAFAEHGPDASLEGIARAAGVGIGTLYRHFPTRQDLVEAIFQDRMEQSCARAADLLSAPGPAEALEAWLWDVLEHAMTYGALAAWLMLQRLDEPCREAPSSCELVRDAGAALLRRAQEAGEVRADVDMDDVLRLLNGIAVGTDDARGSAERLFRVTMDGLRRPRPPAA